MRILSDLFKAFRKAIGDIADKRYMIWLKGLQSATKRILTEIAIQERLHKTLVEGKTLVDLADEKGYKNLKLLETFIKYLNLIDVIKSKKDMFIWEGGNVSVTKDELEVKEIGGPFITLLEEYAEDFGNVLREMSTKTHTRGELLGVWDSLLSTPAYDHMRKKAISYGRFPKDAVILNIGVGTGWSIASLVDELQPKKIIAVDTSADMIEIAKENMENLGITNVEYLTANIQDSLPIDEKIDGAFSSFHFHWIDPNDYSTLFENIRNVLPPGGDYCGVEQLKTSAEEPMLYELHEILLSINSEFKGYPSTEFIIESGKKAGFDNISTFAGLAFVCQT